MDWLRSVAVLSLSGIAILAGGTAIRVAVVAGDRRVAATLGLVALVLVVGIAAGARGRRWRRNPYW